MKANISIDWSTTPSFAIFHQGKSLAYLVLAWWQNDNEMFTRVAVHKDGTWIIDAQQYSFCLYDLEIFWQERNIFIDSIDCSTPNLLNYQRARRTFTKGA